jgi:hypothetical protein
MIKLPSFDALKKAGSDLVDSAKSGKLVDRLKSHIESVGVGLTKEGAEVPKGVDPVKAQLGALQITLKELYQLQAAQSELTKKFETQLGVLAKVISEPESSAVVREEEKKNK